MSGDRRGSDFGPRWAALVPSSRAHRDGRPVDSVEAAGVRIDIAPRQGGKIDQLTGAGRQWLLPGRPWGQQVTPTSDFVAAGPSGWDEMVPTISPCSLGELDYPDHGDAWRHPWGRPDAGGHRFDSGDWNYSLHRHLSTDGSRMRLGYRLTSLVAQPLLWAAHPLFLAPPGSRVILPADVAQVNDIGSGAEELLAWTPDIASIDHVPRGEYRKYAVPPNLRIGRARLVHPDGAWLELSWPGATVRHAAIFFDNGAFCDEPVIAIEPMTGWYDSVARAVSSGTADQFAAGEARHWWVDIAVGDGRQPDHR